MSERAAHYVWADELVWKIRRQLNGGDWRDEDLPSMALQVAMAQVHATLAAAGPGVEQEVRENERRAARAVGAAESQADRQAARPPLTYTRAGDCAETEFDTRGDCDGPVAEYAQMQTGYGLPVGSKVKLCTSHATAAIKGKRVFRAPGPTIPAEALPVCLACGHKHRDGDAHADHQWRDSCPYVGTDCGRPKPGPPRRPEPDDRACRCGTPEAIRNSPNPADGVHTMGDPGCVYNGAGELR